MTDAVEGRECPEMSAVIERNRLENIKILWGREQFNAFLNPVIDSVCNYRNIYVSLLNAVYFSV